MIFLKKIINFLNSIPQQVIIFLKKAFIIFIIWKFLYHLILYKTGFPNNQLTELTAWGTNKLLLFFYPNSFFYSKNGVKVEGTGIGSLIYMDNRLILRIFPACNGLELFVLYIGFLFCFVVKIYRTLLFSILGTLTIYLINILRTAGMAYLIIEHIRWVDFAHHYVFKIIVYSFIFFMWVRYIKELVFHNDEK